MRKLAAGNWKMNGTLAALREAQAIADGSGAAEVLICPPATLIAAMAQAVPGLTLGGQDCHVAEKGAHTGDIAAAMLAEAGASYVILGHSERRADHGESSDLVRAKAEAAFAVGLTAIICIGETLDEREAGTTLDIIGAQLDASVPDAAAADNIVIAYEPVWAIGTGKVPTVEQIGEVHGFIRNRLAARFGDADGMRLLYGGSVKGANAAEIFAVADVDGALVGGASLKAADFLPIVDALNAA